MEPSPSPDDLRVHWVLRVGAALCFIGHGAFGVMGKEAWLPYFAVAGIIGDRAWALMPVVGTVDILIGVLVLVRPRPGYLVYMTLWALWTALLRPLSGESAWEAVERAGNYGVPFALLIATAVAPAGSFRLAGGFARSLEGVTRDRLRRILVLVTALLLVGHGALALGGKPALVAQHALLYPSAAMMSVRASGAVEILLAAALIIRPLRSLALAIALWKLATEGLFLLAGAPIWEVVERAGSYAAPLALFFLHRRATGD